MSTSKHTRTTSMKLEILDTVINNMNDGETKSIIVRRINSCEYDIELMRTLTEEMINLANQINDTYVKKYVGDSGNIYQTWEPAKVSLLSKKIRLNESMPEYSRNATT